MCLIAFALHQHPQLPLLLIGNRDEFHERPSAPLGPWPQRPGVIGGRDLRAGGGWLALGPNGRLAAVTNVREPHGPGPARSRGELVADFLADGGSAEAFAHRMMATAADYGPFNLLAWDGRVMVHASNRPQPHWRPVPPGVHGLSNAGLNAPWPKVERLRAALSGSDLHDDAALLAALADETAPDPAQLPDTGVGLEMERFLGTAFIRAPHYGTRASSLVRIGIDGQWRFTERRFGPGGALQGESVCSGAFGSGESSGAVDR